VIDFRYHLVSIVAVFLALAIGIVLGSTELQGPVYNFLSHTTSQLHNELDNADNERDAAQQSLNADTAWYDANEGMVLHDMLAGQRLVIITEPGAAGGVVTGITAAASDADATVTGEINLQSKFFDGSNSTAISLAAVNSQMAQSAGIQLDSNAPTPQQATAQVLANEILTKPASSVSPAGIQQTSTQQSTEAETTLAAYAQEGFLTTSGQPATPATLAVVVTPQTVPGDLTADPLAQILGPFAQELANVTSTVVAGSAAGSGAGSPIAVLRGTSVSNQVSTVDDADSTVGQITVMEALSNEMSGGKPGAYGMEDGAPNYPTVTPSASPSPSVSATPSTTKKPKK
jgi:hypothetical protein